MRVARRQEGGDDVLLGHLRAGKLADDAPAREDQHAIANSRKFQRVGGVDDAGRALRHLAADGPVDVEPRPGIDALRRLVDQHDFGVVEEAARQHGLLLVAAGKSADRLIEARRHDAELPTSCAACAFSAPPETMPADGKAVEHLQRHVFAHAEFGKYRFGRAVGAEEEDACGDGAGAASNTARRGRRKAACRLRLDKPPSARMASRWPLPSAPANPRISPLASEKDTSRKLCPLSPETASTGAAPACCTEPLRIFRLDRAADHQRDQIVLRKLSRSPHRCPGRRRRAGL